jgi:hypothetical protein
MGKPHKDADPNRKSKRDYYPVRSAPTIDDLKTLLKVPMDTRYGYNDEPFIVSTRGQFILTSVFGGGVALVIMLLGGVADSNWVRLLLLGLLWGCTFGMASFFLRFPVRNHPKTQKWNFPAAYVYGTNLVFVYHRCHDDSFWYLEFFDRYFGWMRDEIIWGVSPWSIQFVDVLGGDGGPLLKDRRFVVYQNLRIPKSNPSELKVRRRQFSGYEGKSYELTYAQDGRYVYFEGFLIDGLDCASFDLLGQGFFKDKNGIYNIGRGMVHNAGASRKYDERDMFYQVDLPPLAEVDKNSFEILPVNADIRARAKDKNRHYDCSGVPCGAQDPVRPFGPVEDKGRAAMRRRQAYDAKFSKENEPRPMPPLTSSGRRFIEAQGTASRSTLCASDASKDLMVAPDGGLQLWVGHEYRQGDRLELLRALSYDARYPKTAASIDMPESCAVRALCTWRPAGPRPEWGDDGAGYSLSLHSDGTISVLRKGTVRLLKVEGPAAGRMWIDILPQEHGFILLDATGELWIHVQWKDDDNCFVIKPLYLQFSDTSAGISGVLGVGFGSKSTEPLRTILVWKQQELALWAIGDNHLHVRSRLKKPLSPDFSESIAQVCCTHNKYFVRTHDGALWMGRIKRREHAGRNLGDMVKILPTIEKTDRIVSIGTAADFYRDSSYMTCLILSETGSLWEVFEQRKFWKPIVNQDPSETTFCNKERIFSVIGTDFQPIEDVEAISSNGNPAILMRDGKVLNRGVFVRPPPPSLSNIEKEKICYARVTKDVRMKFGGSDGDWDDREVIRHFEFLPSERADLWKIAKSWTGDRGVSSMSVSEVSSTGNDHFVITLAMRLEREARKDPPESIALDEKWWAEYQERYPDGPPWVAEVEIP